MRNQRMTPLRADRCSKAVLGTRGRFGASPMLVIGGLAAISAAVWAVGGAIAPRVDRPAEFAKAPEDSLIAKLSSGSGFGPADERVVYRDPASGVVVRRKSTWVPELGVMLVDSRLVNEGDKSVSAGRVPLAGWTFVMRDSFWPGKPLKYSADTWYGSTYFTGPDWARVGRDWHHPGTGVATIRRFEAPRDGHVAITGRVYKADTNGGDGVLVSIRHGDQTVWNGDLAFNDSTGVEPSLALDVRKGDAIRFVVQRRGEIGCDTTHWDPTITYSDGESFQASKGFGETQGANGWYYEMTPDPPMPAHRATPMLRLMDRSANLREIQFGPGDSCSTTGAESLPAFVLSDDEDKSGVLVTLSGDNHWRMDSGMTRDGMATIRLSSCDARTLRPAESVPLPRVVFGAYSGASLAGAMKLQKSLDSSLDLTALRATVRASLDSARAEMDPARRISLRPRSIIPESLGYWWMIQSDWRQADKHPDTAKSYISAAVDHVKRARKLLADLRAGRSGGFLDSEAARLDALSGLAAKGGAGLDNAVRLYSTVHTLKRRIEFSNPLMGFGKLMFCKRVPPSYSHLVMQCFGYRARPGGGIFILDEPGYSLRCQDILGRRLSGGSVQDPKLSYDAGRVVFSYVKCPKQEYDPFNLAHDDADEGYYHVFEARTDGTGFRQLTSGHYDDLMPDYLPDGGIVFSSTRRRGYARCFGPQFSQRWHVYALHRMDGDGGNIRALSFHDTNEWYPVVSNTGRILYARWDYIDRDAVTHQTLWSTRPDGTDPISVWGNGTPSPHCTFQTQPIPGSDKLVYTASAHHSVTGGSIVVLDPRKGDNGHQAITRITPEVPFPEAEGLDIREYYSSPWPLSEKYFLVSYSPKPLVWEPNPNDADALGIYLLDVWGNRELIYRDPEIGSTNPCPLRPRPAPPIYESALQPNAPDTGELMLMDVYQGLTGVPRGSIKQLRIVQIFPKTTNVVDEPPIGLAGEENGRAILGTVPVEPDGSARFTVPARKPILFQALDKDGLAVQTMRTITYLQPGERMSCTGCHENRRSIRPGAGESIAVRRPASTIDPGPLGGRPFSYTQAVQPILDRRCVACHSGADAPKGIDLTGTPFNRFSRSYVSLCRDRGFDGPGTNPTNAVEALVPRYGARNQIQITQPGGMYGALGSRLMKLLRSGHHGITLGPEELSRVGTWIDMNAIFYGVNDPDAQARQLRGETIEMPDIQ